MPVRFRQEVQEVPRSRDRLKKRYPPGHFGTAPGDPGAVLGCYTLASALPEHRRVVAITEYAGHVPQSWRSLGYALIEFCI